MPEDQKENSPIVPDDKDLTIAKLKRQLKAAQECLNDIQGDLDCSAEEDPDYACQEIYRELDYYKKALEADE